MKADGPVDCHKDVKDKDNEKDKDNPMKRTKTKTMKKTEPKTMKITKLSYGIGVV